MGFWSGLVGVLILFVLFFWVIMSIIMRSILPNVWIKRFEAYNKHFGRAINCINNCVREKCGVDKFNACQTIGECGKYKSKGACDGVSFCSWADGACVAKPCEQYSKENGCVSAGCTWGDGVCSGNLVCDSATKKCIDDHSKKCAADSICPNEYRGPGLVYEQVVIDGNEY